jgi:hypothetical protein
MRSSRTSESSLVVSESFDALACAQTVHAQHIVAISGSSLFIMSYWFYDGKDKKNNLKIQTFALKKHIKYN